MVFQLQHVFGNGLELEEKQPGKGARGTDKGQNREI